MPNQIETASHCVVQWEDNKNQYAVVDTKRSKTVSTLKVGVTTLFEGYNRERKRSKILFLAQAIRVGNVSSFERTTSSSSIASMTKTKRRKLNNKNLNNIDEITNTNLQELYLFTCR
ncbi:unnamed protein product [Rotaria sp. Silwood2]|nr:unnamed protein product [Rotaria sp. Silwood2]